MGFQRWYTRYGAYQVGSWVLSGAKMWPPSKEHHHTKCRLRIAATRKNNVAARAG